MSTTPSRQATFLGHPIGLYVLFFTEMWERFSYYGMRAILVLYMVNYFKWSPEGASQIYKWYTSLVYLTPILGGFLADRFLGNKKAVLIGAVLMAIGHFLMAFEAVTIFYGALVFLILGNGMFKPNMSTQVGRLYPPGDPRRDGAYTIFYMGINLGAFMSPLLCGWLAENTSWGYHAGFTAAGVGMVFGLLIYFFGLPLVKELPQDTTPIDQQSPPDAHVTDRPTPAEEGIKQASGVKAAKSAIKSAEVNPLPAGAPDVSHRALSEAEAERTPSAMPALNKAAPILLVIFALLLVIVGPILAQLKVLNWDSVIGMGIAAGASLAAAVICTQVRNAVRDRILAILAMGIFVAVFWAAAEQAGNSLNLWADQTTNRYLTHVPPDVKAPPAKLDKADAGIFSFLNPVPAAWFQSINALGIFVLAPLLAWWWTYNEKRDRGTSIAMKIVFGVLLMALSILFMIGGAWFENQPTTVKVEFSSLPKGVEEKGGKLVPTVKDGDEAGTPYQTGRLSFDPATKTLSMRGVLADVERDRLVRDTAPKSFKEFVEFLAWLTPKLGTDETRKINIMEHSTKMERGGRPQNAELEGKNAYLTAKLPLKFELSEVPPGFDFSLAGFEEKVVEYDPDTKTLTINKPLAEKDAKALLVAAGEPEFRKAVYELYVASSKHRVSASWLFWFYLLATVGELYLSPVGLSMVSKLAPARYATMLMGLWMLTSFFGNFLAGMAGEYYDKIAPLQFFLILTAVVGVVAAGGFLVIKQVTALMHGVK